MSRTGRLPAAERDARRQEIVDAALAVLVERGYEATTMLDVARRAGASKETLYRWFGGRDGLLAELVQRNARATTNAVEAALAEPGDPTHTLHDLAVGLLRLLTGPRSVALNRAAMGSPKLADLLLRHGRHAVGPLVEHWLSSLHDDGILDVPNPGRSFQVFYGLVVRDVQIRVLLGEEPPSDAELVHAADDAVAHFLTLHGHHD